MEHVDLNLSERIIFLSEWMQQISSADVNASLELYREALKMWSTTPLFVGYLSTLVKCQSDHEIIRIEFEKAITEFGVSFDGAAIWTEYINFEESIGDSMRAAYLRKRLERLSSDCKEVEKLSSFESALGDLNSYFAYISFEASRSNPNFPRIRTIYERAIAAFPLEFPLWQAYLEFSRNTSRQQRAYERALKIFPEKAELWIAFLRFLEIKYESGSGVLIDCFEKAIPIFVWNLEDMVWLLLTMFGIIRRMAGIETCAQFCSHYLYEFSKHHKDPQARLEQFYISILISNNQADQAKQIWEAVVKANSRSCSLWLSYISFSAQHFPDSARSLYKRSYVLVSDHPESLFASWLDFENKFGSLEQLAFAEDRITKHRLELLRRVEKVERPMASDVDAIDKPSHGLKRKQEEHHESSKEAKHESHTLFFSNLDYKLSSGKLKAFCLEHFGLVKQVRMPRDREKGLNNKGFAYVEFVDQDSYESAKGHDKIPLEGRPVFINVLNERHEPKITTKRDPKTVYVSHLPHYITAQDLHDRFSKYDGLRDVRLVQAKSGRSRGCAYIEFESEELAVPALAENDTLFGDQRISVAISDPSTKTHCPSLIPSSILHLKPA